MKKIKISRLVWIIGLVLIAGLIIFMIVQFALSYGEDKSLYIYNCQMDDDYESLCTSTSETSFEESDLVSTYTCHGNTCPNIESIINMTEQIIVLQYEDGSRVLYDAKNGKVINEEYKNYYVLVDDEYQVTGYVIQTKDNTYGLMNKEGKAIGITDYEEIGHIDPVIFNDYNNQYITALKNNKYGVIEIATGNVIVDFNYDELHINGNAIIKVQDGLLYPIDRNGNNILNNGYSYIYGYDNLYVTIKDKQLNILDSEENTLNPSPIAIYEDYDYTDPYTFNNISTYQLENIIYILLKNGDVYVEYQYNIDTQELTKI